MHVTTEPAIAIVASAIDWLILECACEGLVTDDEWPFSSPNLP